MVGSGVNVLRSTQEFNDALKNFKLCEALGICSAEKGILVRMCDKISRASTLLSTGAQVEDEKIQDTLKDIINYTLILLNLLLERSPEPKISKEYIT